MTLYVLLTFTALLAAWPSPSGLSARAESASVCSVRFTFPSRTWRASAYSIPRPGKYSAILRIENPVQKFSADIDSYYEYTRLFTALAQTLGEGYALHKQDIFTRQGFEGVNNGKHEF